MSDVDVEGRTIKVPPLSIKLIEVGCCSEEEDKPVPQGMKRVDVEIFWRHEDNKTFDIPKAMELSDVREHICYNVDDYFDFTNSWVTEFEVWKIEDQDTGEEWGL
jgi:hypothetical protein